MEEPDIFLKNGDEFGENGDLKVQLKKQLYHTFSVFIVNDLGERLVEMKAEQRNEDTSLLKVTYSQGETGLPQSENRQGYEVKSSADLAFLFSFIYKVAVENKLLEEEYERLFVVYSSGNPLSDDRFSGDFNWISLKDILANVELNPEIYAYWLKNAADKDSRNTQG